MFPYITQNIQQCRRLIQAKKAYQRGEQLLSENKYYEAQKKYEYINTNIYQNFKDVKEKIKICSQMAYQEQLKQLGQDLDQMRRDFLLINKYLEDAQEKIKQQKQEKQKKKVVKKFRKLPILPQQIKPVGPLTKLPLYSVCFKDPICQECQKKTLVKHQACKSQAYLNQNGYITCNQNCKSFPIIKALYSCKNKSLFSEDQDYYLEDFEQFNDIADVAYFIEQSFFKDKHDAESQFQFRVNVSQSASLMYLAAK